MNSSVAPTKHILLYNPLSGHGHFDSWLALFARFIGDLGYQVSVLTPDKDAFLRAYTGRREPMVSLLNWQSDLDLPFWHRFKKALRRNHTAHLGLHNPVTLAQQLDANGVGGTNPIDLVFVMYIDTYEKDRFHWREFGHLNTLPLAGIRFAPTDDASEGFYELPQMKGMCFLDARFVPVYESKLPTRAFCCLPDLTNVETTANSDFVEVIKRRAAGRTIVFMGGAIGRQKNVALWSDLIRRSDPTQWFFVQIGELQHASLDPEDVAGLDRIRNPARENMFFHDEFVTDERDLNAVIEASDIVFAVYKNFPHSSNMLAKAAHFGKPILVSDRFLMGDRVREHGIGLAVDENSVEAMERGLRDLRQTPVPPESFSNFTRTFGDDLARQALAGMFDKIFA